jgi:hypothetical protein
VNRSPQCSKLNKGPDISLAAQIRRKIAEDQQAKLFPADHAYACYKRYCAIVHVLPMNQDQWEATSRHLFSNVTGKMRESE